VNYFLQLPLSRTFQRFVESERAGGLVLMGCTLLALACANSTFGAGYRAFWHRELAGLSLEHWVNDGLMAVFFLLVGLELERELYSGELSTLRTALLPAIAAAGGLLLPALIYLAINAGTPTRHGFGIPMATDIAFALGVLSLAGARVPVSLKVFVVAFAVMDDLAAIVLIALVYSGALSLAYLAGAALVLVALLVLNRGLRVMALTPYLVGGAVMWVLLLKSGVHATLAGVLLAFAIPYSHRDDDVASPSHRLEHALHLPVAFVVLPLFALANTAIVIGADWVTALGSASSLGIMAGLLLGKPLGVTLACVAGVRLGLCRLPVDLGWRHVVGAGLLGGIGFTMSIFVTNLAFGGDAGLVNDAKMAILCASLVAGAAGCAWLRASSAPRDGAVR